MTTKSDSMRSGAAPRTADSNGEGPHRDFVGFRERLERLVQSLVALRHIPDSNQLWDEEAEHVEVVLDADEFKVEFTVALLSWKTATALSELFHRTFAGGDAPLFFDFNLLGHLTLHKPREEDARYRRLFGQDRTTLEFKEQFGGSRHDVAIRAGFPRFDDHFETFVLEAAKILFPPVEKPKAPLARDAEAWHEEVGREFERIGCRVLRDSEIGWRDLVGLERVRTRLEQAVLLPLVRQELCEKVARAVMSGPVSLLPRGVLLVGPPGTGKTWSMRALASEADIPVVALPCDALMTKWYGESEQRLASVFRLCRDAGRMILLIDELEALTRHRQDSHETTARLVSILLAEMDGLAGASEVVLVGSANSTTTIDRAVLDRFDVKIEFDLPDAEQRRCALAYYARHLSEQEVTDLAERTDGWNFRRLARFAEGVVRTYVAGLDLSQLEAQEPPLPRMEDYVKELGVSPTVQSA